MAAFGIRPASLLQRYAALSESRPHLTAGLTAGGIICSADVACQRLLQPSADGHIDWRRTVGLTLFGLLHCALLQPA